MDDSNQAPRAIERNRSESTIEESEEDNLQREQLASNASVQTTTSAAPSERASRRTAVLASAVTTAVVVALFAVLVGAGLNNGYSFTVVDQQERAATTHLEPGDAFDVVQREEYICRVGGDYSGCLYGHIAVYNSVCLESLTFDARKTCESLSKFVESGRATLATCGYGCTTGQTADGTWGWKYLRLVSRSVEVSDKNQLPEITHQERCTFDLGPIKLGNCPRRLASQR